MGEGDGMRESRGESRRERERKGERGERDPGIERETPGREGGREREKERERDPGRERDNTNSGFCPLSVLPPHYTLPPVPANENVQLTFGQKV